MSIDNSSPGFNGKFYWFTAVVENVNDPRKMGRLRCRIIGKDTDRLYQQPSDQLHWAMPLHPLTGTHMSLDVKPGDYVSGYFLDDRACQMPIIFGVYPAIKRTEDDTTRGFSPQLTTEEQTQVPEAPAGIQTAGKDVNTVTGAPLSARGVLEGTLTAQTNAEVVHVCDIATQVRRSVIWEDLKQSQLVSEIRQAIQALITSLGFSPDSLSQRVIQAAQFLKRQLQNLQNLIQKINDWLQISVEFAAQLRAIVDWILVLPARLQSALTNCLSAFLSGITSLLSDVLTLPSAQGSDISSALSEVKKTVDQASSTLVTAQNTLTIPAQIADVLVTPSSISSVAAVQSKVDSYINSQTETNQSAINTAVDLKERTFSV